MLLEGYQGLNDSLATIPPSERDRLESALQQIIQLYEAWEKPAEAATWLAKLLENYRETIAALPADSTERAGSLAQIGLSLLEAKHYAAAETFLRECLLIRDKTLPDDWLRFNTQSMLGGALAGQKKLPEAEPLLLEGYSGLKDREAKIPPAAKIRLTEAIRRLVDLYTAWDKPEEAEKWRAKLQEANPDEK